MTSGRHASHSVYSRFNSGEKIGRSTNTQDALANVISRQPLVVAICSIAGNQCDACESPTSATVKVPAGFPYVHDFGLLPLRLLKQPSAISRSLSSLAATNGG